MNSSSYATLTQELYVAYFGRPADYLGLQNFEAALAGAGAPTDSGHLLEAYGSNATLKALVDSFGTSSESKTFYAGTSTSGFVNAVFENLFDRNAAVDGLNFWVNAITSGQLTMGEAALSIAAGAQGNTTTQGLIDAQTLANKIGGAQAFTSDLSLSSFDIVSYSGAIAATEGRFFLTGITADTTVAQYTAAAAQAVANINVPPPTEFFSLTTGTDVIDRSGVAGDMVFNAILDNYAGLSAGGQAQTLDATDSLIGGTLFNTLNLADFGTGGVGTIPLGATISGMTSININSLEGFSADFSNWSRLTNLHVGVTTGTDSFTVANDVTVTITDTGDVNLQGGSDITISADAAHAVAIVTGATQLKLSLADSSNTVNDVAANAFIAISAGQGNNVIALGNGAHGLITFGSHTGPDSVMLGTSGTVAGTFVTISGLNNAGADIIGFAGEAGNTLTGFLQVSAANVTASGADASLLASWVAAADGAAGSGVAGSAHGVTWFVFQGNTYVLESVAGQSADGGVMAAGNTLVELMGTGYTFAHASGANGALHLLG